MDNKDLGAHPALVSDRAASVSALTGFDPGEGALLALAERCEAATGADREMDADIALALGDVSAKAHVRFPAYAHLVRHFTASLDAAMQLVPDGWFIGALYFVHPDFRTETDREWHVDIQGPITWAESDGMPDPVSEFRGGNATTPALALTAAALRARAAQEPGK